MILLGKAPLSAILQCIIPSQECVLRGTAQTHLVPFPLPVFSPSDLAHLEAGTVPDSDVARRCRWGRDVWTALVVSSLNYLHLGRAPLKPDLTDRSQFCRPPIAAQRKALKLIDEYVEFFLKEGEIPQID